MRIAIVGCGAMGSIYAGLLASAGNDVLALVGSAEQKESIRKNGLRTEGASGDRVTTLRVETEAPAIEQDLVIIATKAPQAGAAARGARPLIGPSTMIVAMQNGLGSAEDVANAIGADNLVVGIAAGFGSSMLAHNHARHEAMEKIQFGPYASSALDLTKLERAWRDAGFQASAVDDITARQWEKLICNAAYSALAGVIGCTVGTILESPHLHAVSCAAATEAWEIARKRDVALTVADPVAHIIAFGRRVSAARPSVLQDIEAGKKSEIDYINGAVPREAAKAGLSAPVNQTLTELVHHREQTRSTE